MAEGYLIEDGRITTPLRGATLVGNGIDILMKIDMIAGDFDVKIGHLRQGRPGRAGGHRPGHPAHRGDDGGRDGLMFEILDAVLERALARGAADVEVYAERA